MANETVVTPTRTETLPPVGRMYPELETAQKPKEPNKFLRILGGIAGTAIGMVAPGLGGLLGNVISGGSGSVMGGSYGGMIEQQRQFEEMQRVNQMQNTINQQQQNQMMNQQQRQSMQLLGVQQRVSMQAQEFTTVSNLMKSRHDSEMSAVNNIKS